MQQLKELIERKYKLKDEDSLRFVMCGSGGERPHNITFPYH